MGQKQDTQEHYCQPKWSVKNIPQHVNFECNNSKAADIENQ